MTIIGLAFWLGVYWVVVGVISLVHLIMGRTQQQRVWTAAKAVLEIVGGLFVLSYPAFSAAIASALFLMTTEGKPELFDELEAHHAIVMSTTVSGANERRLRDALAPE